jgi:uncharacterized repeat protein (TIGR03943 family)
MDAAVKRDAQGVLLLLVGATLLKIGVLGTYVRYVKPTLLPLLLVAGAALVAVGGATLWQVVRAARAAPVTAKRTGRGHGHRHAAGHDHEEPRVGWLLLVPTLTLLLFAPPALGAFQADRNGTALSSVAGSDFAPLPAGDPVRLSLMDYAARAVFDTGRSLAGRRVVVSGFVIVRPDAQPYLARLVVTCCAADARPIKVGLDGPVPSDLAADAWIEVEGTYTERSDRDEVNGDVIPYLRVVSTRDIPAPEQQYES